MNINNNNKKWCDDCVTTKEERETIEDKRKINETSTSFYY